MQGSEFTLQRVGRHRAVSQRELELAYLDRLTLEVLINTDKYTPLGGASQAQGRRAEMRAVFELMPLRLDQAAHEMAAPRRFENAVAEILKLRRAESAILSDHRRRW